LPSIDVMLATRDPVTRPLLLEFFLSIDLVSSSIVGDLWRVVGPQKECKGLALFLFSSKALPIFPPASLASPLAHLPRTPILRLIAQDSHASFPLQTVSYSARVFLSSEGLNINCELQYPTLSFRCLLALVAAPVHFFLEGGIILLSLFAAPSQEFYIS